MAKVVSELGPGSGMWRFSLPPIPRSPPPHLQPRVPPRSSYQEKREPNASPVRALTAWSSQKTSAKGLSDAKPGLDGTTHRNSIITERRLSITSSDGENIDENDDSEEAKWRRKCASLEAELELERSQKVRGTNKFMGGGQFKSAANNKAQRQCAVCFTLRETMQRMSIEHDEVLETNTYLIAEVERLKAELDNHTDALHGLGKAGQEAQAIAKRLEAERDGLSTAAAEHRAAAAAARIELDKKAWSFDEMREQWQKDSDAMKEQIRKLQEQLLAREREVEQFKQTAQQFEQRTAAAQSRLEQVNVDLREAHKVRNLQAKRLDDQEQHIEELKARLAEMEQRPVVEDRSEYIDRLEKRIAELEQRLREALEGLSGAKEEATKSKEKTDVAIKELKGCREELVQRDVALAEVKRELDTSRARAADLIVANQDLQTVSKEMVATIEGLETKTSALESYIAELERQLAELQGSAGNEEHWRIRLEEKEKVINDLQVVVQGHEALLHDNRLVMENLREDVTEAQEKAQGLEEEIKELKRKLRETESQSAKHAETASSALKVCSEATEGMEKAKVLNATLEKVAVEHKDEIGRLKKEVTKKDKTILELMEKHLKDLERAKQEALEKTMQSMVRLCVVAPTVNVSFGSEALTCKAGLPGDRIHDIIESQILPGFIQLFLQPKEGIGPDGSQLSKWVERLMGDMQGSIEKHLAGVFRAAKEKA